MTASLLAPLVVLALVDSTSFGTLGVPVYLLVASDRPPIGRLLTYLGTIAAFYFAVGVGLMLGLATTLDAAGEALHSRTAYWIQLVVGVGLFLLSFRFDPKRRRRRADPGRRWESRLAGSGSVVLVGLTAGLIEVATMVPYLAAIGMLTTSGLPATQWIPVLAGYTVIMVVPALLLLAVRMLASGWLEPKLLRLRAWMTKHSAEAVGWALGIVGFLLARDAAAWLWFSDR